MMLAQVVVLRRLVAGLAHDLPLFVRVIQHVRRLMVRRAQDDSLDPGLVVCFI